MRAGIYCRLSEEDRDKQKKEDDSKSIQNQKSMLIQYALEQGWEIYQIYSDDDYAGADRKRPQFNALLADAEARNIDIVLCKSQSRFTRELELVEKYIHGLFPIWGIRFIGLADNADTANKGNKKSRQINGLVNEWYLEDMSENIRSVLTNHRINGRHIGAFALYGYQKDPEQEGHLIIDPPAAAVVHEVFTLFAQGYGKTKIAQILNERGIPNPTEYKRRQGLRYKAAAPHNSTLWKYYSIADMLVNEMYIGTMVQGRYGSVSFKTRQNRPRPKELWYRKEHTHEPIIERPLWDHVQALLAERAKPFSTGEVGIFARKTRCAYCGYTLKSAKKGDNRYLHCPNHHADQSSCEGAFISVSKLERAVLEELDRLSDEYLDMDEVERQTVFLPHVQAQREALESSISARREKIEVYRKGIRDLYLDKTRGILTEEDYVALSQEFSAERDRLERLNHDAERKLRDLAAEMSPGSSKRQRIEQYTRPSHLDRETVLALINYVVVGRRIPGTRTVPIEIHWNF